MEVVHKKFNPNPIVYGKLERQPHTCNLDDDQHDVQTIDQSEVFDHLRDIMDPEHPYTLEDLRVITKDAIEVDDERGYVEVTFTPTSNICPFTMTIGLCLQVKLMRSLPSRYKVNIKVAPGSHKQEASVNKQLNDKERVAAAMENKHISNKIEEYLAASFA